MKRLLSLGFFGILFTNNFQKQWNLKLNSLKCKNVDPEIAKLNIYRFHLGATLCQSAVVCDQGLQVIIVKPNTVAEKAKLQESDYIVEIDGYPIKTIEDFY